MIEGHGFAGFGEKIDNLADPDMGKVALELGWIGENDPFKQGTRVGIMEFNFSVPALIQQILCGNFLPAQDEGNWDGMIG